MRAIAVLALCAATAACTGDDDDGPSTADAAAQAVDAALVPDASGTTPDADVNAADAAPGAPDAMVGPDAAPSAAVRVAAYHTGNTATCVVKSSDRTFWCAANNTATQVGTATDWGDAIWVGAHSCGLKQDNSLWCWGENGAGQVGDGTQVDLAAPKQIGSATDWSAIAGVSGGTCGVRSGQLWCWGANLADAPTQMGSDTNWVDVGGVVNTIRARRSDGTLWEVHYQAGITVGPNQIGTDTDWASLGGGGRGQCMSKTSGALWCVGDSSNRDPVEYDGGNTGWMSGVHSDLLWVHGLKTDGTIWRIANNGTTQLFTPQGTWTSVKGDAAGGVKCLTRANGELWCFGISNDGRMGTSANLSEPSPVPFTL